MGDDIEHRLAAATADLHRFRAATLRANDMRERQQLVEDHLASLRAAHAIEERDVQRLEKLTITRILSSLRHAREDDVARERAEADAARYRVAEAEALRQALRREHDAARAEIDQLAEAPATYDRVLAEKERHLAESDDPRGRALLDLAEDRGQLTGQAREVAEADAAAQAAGVALDRLSRTLASAKSWSTYDTFFNGGIVSSIVKHSRLDDAAQQAADADRALLLLRTELADVDGSSAVAPSVRIDGLTRTIDIWFDNIFTDFTVRQRIVEARQRAAAGTERVRALRAELAGRAETVEQRLSAVAAERLALLTQS